jgi:transcriptional regulator with XRE-family HTH domain
VFKKKTPKDLVMELLQKLGKRIKDVRKKLGLSQQELAALIDYEKSHMSRLESGGTNPTYLTLMKIATGLKISMSDLLDGL